MIQREGVREVERERLREKKRRREGLKFRFWGQCDQIWQNFAT